MTNRGKCATCKRPGRELRTTRYELVPATILAAGRRAGIDVPPARVCVDSGDCILHWQ